MSSDYERESNYLDQCKYAQNYWAPYLQDAQVYNLAAAGYTWSDKERIKFKEQGRDALELNITRQPLEFYSGYLRDNLNQVVYGATEDSDTPTADQLTKMSYHVWDKGNGYNRFLNSCDEMFKAGISLAGLRMNYNSDFINGDLEFYYRTYNTFYLDPNFSTLDLSDCGYAITRDVMNKESAKLLLTDVSASLIDSLAGSFTDNKFLQSIPNNTSVLKQKNAIVYDQHYLRTTRMREYVIDKNSYQTTDITELSSDKKKQIRNNINKTHEMRRHYELFDVDPSEIPDLEIRKVNRPYIEVSVYLNGKFVKSGEDETGIVEEYPFAPNLCYFEPSIHNPSLRIQGVPATVWSNQRQFNKRHMKIVDMMDSDIAKGYKYLLGSVPNLSDLHDFGQNVTIGVDPDNAPEGLNSVQELVGGGANPTLIQYQEVLDSLNLKLANVTESVLGSDEGGNTQVSGRLAQVRIAQGLTGNRKVFDNIETTQKLLGEKALQIIQNKYPAAKIKRILGEEPTEQFYNKSFGKFDAVVKQGIRSQSQKDAYYYELINLKREQIVDVPQSEIIRAMSMVGLTDLEKAIEAQEEQQKIQQQKIDEQERIAIELANSQAEANLAMSAERRARIQSDLALATERISESEENRAQAALAKAKTITEISQLEDDRIIKVLEFVNMLEREEIQDREAIGSKVSSQAQDIENSQISQLNTETQGSAENKAITQTNGDLAGGQFPQL